MIGIIGLLLLVFGVERMRKDDWFSVITGFYCVITGGAACVLALLV